MHFTTERPAGIKVAKQEGCVGYGGFRPSPVVAGRTRIRARAARSNLEQPCRFNVGDAASASPDLDEVDCGQAHRPAAAFLEAVLAGGFELGGNFWLFLCDQA